MAYSLSAQIEEVEREILLRGRVYPHQVASRKMRQSVADMHLDRMRAVLRTLEWLRANETAIKAKVGELV
jgi:hypothetical protein